MVTTRIEDLREVQVLPRIMHTGSITITDPTLPAAGTGKEEEGKGVEETAEVTLGSPHQADLREATPLRAVVVILGGILPVVTSERNLLCIILSFTTGNTLNIFFLTDIYCSSFIKAEHDPTAWQEEHGQSDPFTSSYRWRRPGRQELREE